MLPSLQYFTIQSLLPQRLHPPCLVQCGSCWAWATAATLESALLIERQRHGQDHTGASPAGATSSEPSLSVQQIVSCVNSELGYTSQGCGGGFPEQAFNYIHRFNISEESFYAPYS